MEEAIYLAQLDGVVRLGFIYPNLGDAAREDVRDLNKLLSIFNPAQFRAKDICLLNPIFGKASHLIGGADADLCIDGMLIDIKTTKNFDLSRKYFN